MYKYKLSDISCASCAAKIEEELGKLPDVNEVSLNFSTSILNIDYDNLSEIRKIIKKIEPGGDIEIISDNKKAEIKSERG